MSFAGTFESISRGEVLGGGPVVPCPLRFL
jgi:hypothetical protein